MNKDEQTFVVTIKPTHHRTHITEEQVKETLEGLHCSCECEGTSFQVIMVFESV